MIASPRSIEEGWSGRSAFYKTSGSDFDPHPQPRNSLVRISVCNQVSNGNSYYGEPGQGKNCSRCSFQDFHSLTKGNQVSLGRIHFSHPESDGKSSDVGVGGRIGILTNQREHCSNRYFNAGFLSVSTTHRRLETRRASQHHPASPIGEDPILARTHGNVSVIVCRGLHSNQHLSTEIKTSTSTREQVWELPLQNSLRVKDRH